MKRQTETTATQTQPKRRKIEALIDESQTQNDLEEFTCDQLRGWLKIKHMNEKGLKADLVQRIFEFLSGPRGGPKMVLKPRKSIARKGTLLAILPSDLHPIIYEYWRHKTRFEERGAIKDSYTFKYDITLPTKALEMNPMEVALDAFGGVYVADSKNNSVHVFHVDGRWIKTIGGPGDTNGRFRFPTALTVDFGGNLVVSDQTHHRAQIFDPSGHYSSKIGGPEAGKLDGEFDHPCDVIIDNDGNYVIADTDNERIQIFTPEGDFIRKFDARMPKKLADGLIHRRPTPVDVAVDFEGNFIVCDCDTHQIQFFDANGTFLRSFGVSGADQGQLRCPQGVTADRNGNLIISDSGNSRIQLFSNQGKFLMSFGKKGSAEGEMMSPIVAVLDQEGNLFVADNSNHRIAVFG